VPLLDEKTLNARQFEMVVARVEQMLAAAVQARRAELSVSGDPAPAPPLAPARAPAGGYARPDWDAAPPPQPPPWTPAPPPQGSGQAAPQAHSAADPFALHAPAAAPPPSRSRPAARAAAAAAAPRQPRAPPKQQDATWTPPGAAAQQLDANAAEIARLRQQLASASVGGGAAVADQIASARTEIRSLESQLSRPPSNDPFGAMGAGLQHQTQPAFRGGAPDPFAPAAAAPQPMGGAMHAMQPMGGAMHAMQPMGGAMRPMGAAMQPMGAPDPFAAQQPAMGMAAPDPFAGQGMMAAAPPAAADPFGGSAMNGSNSSGGSAFGFMN